MVACSEDEPKVQVGCSTGMRDGKRQLVSCGTKEQYLAGSNVAAGGVSWFGNYTQHQWEPAKNCKECEDKYW